MLKGTPPIFFDEKSPQYISKESYQYKMELSCILCLLKVVIFHVVMQYMHTCKRSISVWL